MAHTPKVSVFTLPVPAWSQPPASRVARFDRKRKIGESHRLDDETTDVASVIDLEPEGPSLVLTPNEAHQYRIAGHPFHKELPKGKFPHEPPQEKAKRETALSQLEALADLSNPIYPVPTGEQTNVRLKQLGVLTAILHRCMLEGDYVRAGRAWGMIMRENTRGSPLDVRNEGRWGIGAELLLRGGRKKPAASLPGSKPQEAASSTTSGFSAAGFVQAKEYYERLILNHPFTRSSPQSASSLHFYPAMFGLWVYVTQERSSWARNDITARLDEEYDEFDYSDDGSEYDPERKREMHSRKAISVIRGYELQEARQISMRMDQILVSPPYSDSAELLELRGMLSLWIGDLVVSSIALPTELDEDDDYENDRKYRMDRMDLDESPEVLEARRQLRIANDKRSLEVKRSAEFFEKAQKRGRNIARNLDKFHLRDFS